MRATLLLILVLVPLSLFADTIHEGKVIKIADGDTLTILVDKQQLKIRLSDLDTPERKQPFGTRAKQALSDLAYGKQARVVEVTKDRYGRIVGRVYVDGIDVNRELVAQGYAWVYRKYSDDAELLRLEAEAKRQEFGLWADAHPIPPWDWRRGERASKRTAATGAVFTCGTKRYCREMTSCKEAQFYLLRCGLTRLDGDKDGVPCEKICR